MKSNSELNIISGEILDSCFTVHRLMGPGLLESVYEHCLLKELDLRGLRAQNQVPVPLVYRGYELSKDFRIDSLVEDEIILEIKSSEILHPVYEAQLISYLKLSNKRLGFLINFNVPVMKQGFRRYVNNF